MKVKEGITHSIRQNQTTLNIKTIKCGNARCHFQVPSTL